MAGTHPALRNSTNADDIDLGDIEVMNAPTSDLAAALGVTIAILAGITLAALAAALLIQRARRRDGDNTDA
jgi:hypothetical protein